jgi:hypothetical protein
LWLRKRLGFFDADLNAIIDQARLERAKIDVDGVALCFAGPDIEAAAVQCTFDAVPIKEPSVSNANPCVQILSVAKYSPSIL